MKPDELTREELRQLGRGDLWTAIEAEAHMGLCEGQVDIWRHRGYIEPGLTIGRSRYYWEHDLYDCKLSSRKQRKTRDQDTGRFQPRVAIA